MGPSQVRDEDRYTVRLYLQAGTDPQVYDNVKHVFWQASGTVLGILQTFPEDDTHRYLYWPREALLWFQVTQQRFENRWRADAA